MKILVLLAIETSPTGLLISFDSFITDGPGDSEDIGLDF